jgi:hypothetical protein
MDDLGVPRGGGFDWDDAEDLARVLLGENPARGVSMDTATDAARDLP